MRLILFITLTLSSFLGLSQAQTPEKPRTVQALDGGGRGEVLIYTANGQEELRIGGFLYPRYISSRAGGEQIAVLDLSLRQLITVDREGRLIEQMTVPQEILSHELYSMTLDDRSLIVAAGQGGAYKISLAGKESLHYPSPVPGWLVTGAVGAEDGTIIAAVTVPNVGGKGYYRLSQDSSSSLKFSPNEGSQSGVGPRLASCGQGSLLTWDASWSRAYRLNSNGSSLGVLSEIPRGGWPVVVSAACDESGNVLLAGEDFSLSYIRAGVRHDSFSVFSVLGTAVLREGFAASHIREPSSGWPQSLPPLPAASSFPWRELLVWSAVSLLLSLGLSALFAWRRRGWAERPAEAPMREDGKPVSSMRSWLGWTLSLPGLYGLGSAVSTLEAGRGFGSLAMLAGSLAITAAGIFCLRRGDPAGWIGLEDPPRYRSFGLLVPLLFSACISAFILDLGFKGGAYEVKVHAWIAGLVFVLAQIVFPAWRERRTVGLRGAVFDLSLPLLIGAVTLFYRLSSIPTNMHFDFTYHAMYSWYVLVGYTQNIWTPGFVPVPSIGNLPEMAGILLAGPGQLGFRLGAALFGLVSLCGAYFLARGLYRDRRVAVAAAVLLAGAIPFIHFNRLNTAGVTAGAAVWAFASFVWALRSASPRWWLIFGLWLGYCFYVWPPARVAPLALVITAVLLFLVRPRLFIREIYGPFLALGVWVLAVAPVIPDWAANIHLLFPRVQESMVAVSPSGAVRPDFLQTSLAPQLGRSLGWLFFVPDQCTQGTLSPGLNRVEAFLLLLGLAALLSESFFVIGSIVPWWICFLLFCGALADNPPYYTRLLPTLPIAAILMARGAIVLLDVLSRRRWQRIFFAILLLALVFAGPVTNFRKYARYETGRLGNYPMFEMVAMGRAMRRLAPTHELFLITTGRADLSLDLSKRTGRLAELLPLIFDLQVSEIRDLRDSLPMCRQKPLAMFAPAARMADALAATRRVYREAVLEDIRGYNNEVLGGVIKVSAPCSD